MRRRHSGFTIPEMLIAQLIGLLIVSVTISLYRISGHTARATTDSATLHEHAELALDTLEHELWHAGNWGLTNRTEFISTRKSSAPAAGSGLVLPAKDCGPMWSIDLDHAIDALASYTLACPGSAVQAGSDLLVVRTTAARQSPATAGRLQILSTLDRAELFTNGALPFAASASPHAIHDLVSSAFYVSRHSNQYPHLPSLRRKVLRSASGRPVIRDEEVAPGVENLQIELGIDTDTDGQIDSYAQAGDPRARLAAASRAVISIRVSLLLRSEFRINNDKDPTHYRAADANFGTFNDGFQRRLITRTILLRNLQQ